MQLKQLATDYSQQKHTTWAVIIAQSKANCLSCTAPVVPPLRPEEVGQYHVQQSIDYHMTSYFYLVLIVHFIAMKLRCLYIAVSSYWSKRGGQTILISIANPVQPHINEGRKLC